MRTRTASCTHTHTHTRRRQELVYLWGHLGSICRRTHLITRHRNLWSLHHGDTGHSGEGGTHARTAARMWDRSSEEDHEEHRNIQSHFLLSLLLLLLLLIIIVSHFDEFCSFKKKSIIPLSCRFLSSGCSISLLPVMINTINITGSRGKAGNGKIKNNRDQSSHLRKKTKQKKRIAF